jgi:HK97 family phage major capsid protein
MDDKILDDEKKTPIQELDETLSRAIDGIGEDANAAAVGKMLDFARALEAKRSRKPPIPSHETPTREADERPASQAPQSRAGLDSRDGEAIYARDLRVIGDTRDRLYSRMEEGRSRIEVEELRASRNPRMDDLAQEWAATLISRNVNRREELYEELNGRFFEALGYSRAPLLTGLPDASSGFAVGSGADLLPLPLASQLIVERDKASKMRGLVNTFPMTSSTERIPVLPTMAATSRLENAAYADVTPTSDGALLHAKDIGVSFSAGRNFLEDSAFNLANQLTVVAGGAIGAEEDIQICTSTADGGDITEGLGAATITDIVETTSTTIGFVDLVALYYGVPEQYRANAKWFATDTTLQDLLQILDGNARPVLLGGMDAPQAINDVDPMAVGTILRHAVYEVPLADDEIFFGDPMWYALGTRAGIRVDAERAVTTGLWTWVIDERIDGRVIPTSAVDTNNAWRKIVY